MKVAVTGASGHIGANLVRRLLEAGHEVRALVREDVRALEGLEVTRVAGDVREPATLGPLVAGAEVVFHLAARISLVSTDAELVRATNIEGVRNVVAAALGAKVRRLVHFSSVHAFHPDPLDQPVDETRGPSEGPGTLEYDRSKAAGEREVLAGIERGLDAVIVNPTGVIGPHDYKISNMGGFFVRLCNRKLPGLVDGGFNWVDVRDLCGAALTALERGRRGERYLVTGHRAHVAELATLVHEFTGVKAPWMVAPMWLARATAPLVGAYAKVAGTKPAYRSGELLSLRHYKEVRRDKAERELGYAPRPLRETVKDTLDWLRGAKAIPA